MIRLELLDNGAGPKLVVTTPENWGIRTAPLDRAARALQARLLADAAAALIEEDEGLADAFERLHEAMDLLPAEKRAEGETA